VNAQDLIGTWRLRSWKSLASDGPVIEPFGARPVSYLFYTTMATCRWRSWRRIARLTRMPTCSAARRRSGPRTISTYLSYSGPFEVLEDQDTVIHHIEVCSYPNWVGNAQVRMVKLDHPFLTLSTKPMKCQGIEQKSELVWERVGHD
jgi:hypothetical protein